MDLEQCTYCGNTQETQACLLGLLGSLAHFRCRYCGADWCRTVESVEGFSEYAAADATGNFFDAEA